MTFDEMYGDADLDFINEYSGRGAWELYRDSDGKVQFRTLGDKKTASVNDNGCCKKGKVDPTISL